MPSEDLMLRESEVRFRRLFETAQDGILLLDAETGRITDANQFLLDLLGYARGELLGKRLWELGFVKDIGAAKAAFAALQRTGYVRYDDLPLETKDGHNMEVEFISNVYSVGPQRVIQCNIRDVSERKRLDHLKDDFLGTVSHEIRTPLSILRMGIENLEASRSGRLENDESAIIVVLKRNAEKLGKLINDLLDLSRFESGRMRTAIQTVQIGSLIEEVIEGARKAAEERGLALGWGPENNLPPVQADPDLLMRILTNLLDNALRFAKSQVMVTARKAGADLEVSVANDGRGIKTEHIPTLFNKFVQVNRPVGGAGYKGTGLGLAICSEIIKLHGGRIWAESSEEGGSQFHFSVPLNGPH
jgi:PAS domain S-box-containing protein